MKIENKHQTVSLCVNSYEFRGNPFVSVKTVIAIGIQSIYLPNMCTFWSKYFKLDNNTNQKEALTLFLI